MVRIRSNNSMIHRVHGKTEFPCSTAEFRNAFLKTIRQIIRESVRNMNLPPLSGQPPPPPRQSRRGAGRRGGGGGDGSDASEEDEDDDDDSRHRPLPPPPPPHAPQSAAATASMPRGGVRPRPPLRAHGSGGGSLQRHSSGGDIDYDNVEKCGGVRARSRTLGDGMGEQSTGPQASSPHRFMRSYTNSSSTKGHFLKTRHKMRASILTESKGGKCIKSNTPPCSKKGAKGQGEAWKRQLLPQYVYNLRTGEPFSFPLKQRREVC